MTTARKPLVLTLHGLAGDPLDFYRVEEVTLPDTPSAARAAPAHVIYIVDRSGSMWGDMAPMRATLKKLLTLDEFKRPGLLVTLISYSSRGDVQTHFARVSVEQIMAPGSAEQRAIDALQPTGLTCISQALALAESMIKADEVTAITLHSDGYANDRSPTEERREIEQIAARIAQHPRAFVNTVAYRESSDFALLAGVANRCSGACVQARSIGQVYEALHGTATVVAGAVEPTIEIPADGADYVMFHAPGRRMVLGSADGLSVRGLAPNDLRFAWRLRRIPRSEARHGDHLDAVDLRPLLVYCRAQIAEGNLNRAKYALAASRLRELLRTHARALTPTEIAAFAEDVDAVLCGDGPMPCSGRPDPVAPFYQTGPNLRHLMVEPGAQSVEYGLGAQGASALDVINALARYPRSVLVDLPALAGGYKRRGVKRIPGTRRDDGGLDLPPVTSRFRDDSDRWVTVNGFELNTADATVNVLISRAVDLVDRVSGDVVREVAGVKLDDVRTFNNYTLIGDGSVNVAVLRVRLTDKRTHDALAALGVDVGGEFDHTRAIAIPLGSLPVVRYGQKFDAVTPATVTALMRYTVLSKALAAALKADAGRFTPAQVAELKTRCLTPALYFSPPTTTVYDDLRKAIDRGEVDTRIGYKIQIGTPEILHVGELYAGNEYLARRFTVTGADGVEVKKPTMVDALAPGAKVAIKTLSSRTKLNAVDAISYPIYSSLLGGNVPGAVDAGGSAVVNDMLHEAGMRVRDVDRWRKAMISDKPDDRAAALRSALDLVEEHLAATWAELRPLVFYVGASGLVPDELGAVALDAAALAQRFPDVSLGKAEKEGTFFVLPGDVVLSVYTVQAHYTVDRPAAPASAAA